MEPPRFFFFLTCTASSDSKLEQSWQMWTWYHCSGNLASFFGSATKPCGPCFMSQSTTKWLVASALSSGQHSEEPRVVVTKGNTDRTKFDGICWFIFGDLFRRNGVTFATSSEHRQRVLGNPSGTIPWCCLTPNQQESTFVSAPSSDTVRQLDAASNTGCPSPRAVVLRSSSAP